MSRYNGGVMTSGVNCWGEFFSTLYEIVKRENKKARKERFNWINFTLSILYRIINNLMANAR